MMAKPAVEPRARWALMIPDAMPARSAGTDAIATFVVGDSAKPVAALMSSSPTITITSGLPMPDGDHEQTGDEEGDPDERRAATTDLGRHDSGERGQHDHRPGVREHHARRLARGCSPSRSGSTA